MYSAYRLLFNANFHSHSGNVQEVCIVLTLAFRYKFSHWLRYIFLGTLPICEVLKVPDEGFSRHVSDNIQVHSPDHAIRIHTNRHLAAPLRVSLQTVVRQNPPVCVWMVLQDWLWSWAVVVMLGCGAVCHQTCVANDTVVQRTSH